MKYLIHNVRDAEWNTDGMKYSVMSINGSHEFNEKNIIRREVIESELNSASYHLAAVMRCIEWVMKDAAKNDCIGNMEIHFQINHWRKTIGELLK